MKNWKKVIIVSVLMVAVLFSSIQVAEAAPAKGYTFQYSGVTVSVHGEAKKLIKKAGTPIKKSKTKSCAYNGEDTTYKYKDFTLVTYTNKKGGTEYVQSIEFNTKKVKTDKGIKIGSKENDLLKKYGKKGSYNKLSGIYTYKKGKMGIQFTVKENIITAIKYVSYI